MFLFAVDEFKKLLFCLLDVCALAYYFVNHAQELSKLIVRHTFRHRLLLSAPCSLLLQLFCCVYIIHNYSGVVNRFKGKNKTFFMRCNAVAFFLSLATHLYYIIERRAQGVPMGDCCAPASAP